VIGLDTYVLVRYLAQDEPKQAARATRAVDVRRAVRPHRHRSRADLRCSDADANILLT